MGKTNKQFRTLDEKQHHIFRAIKKEKFDRSVRDIDRALQTKKFDHFYDEVDTTNTKGKKYG